MNQSHKQIRILGVSLSSPGFGYAVLESDKGLVNFGKMLFTRRKNAGSIAGIEKAIVRNRPDILVLQDVNVKGSRRRPRIKTLHCMVLVLARKHRLKVAKIPAKDVWMTLLGKSRGAKQEMAELMAKRFPEELSSRLPPKRKDWESEDRRMDIFDAVALAVVYASTAVRTDETGTV